MTVHSLQVAWFWKTYPPAVPYYDGAKGMLGFRYCFLDEPFNYDVYTHETPPPLAEAVKLHEIVIPYWALIVFSLVPAGLLSRRCLIVWRRTRAGLCPQCGYDLRATKERCPECGLAAASQIKTEPKTQ